MARKPLVDHQALGSAVLARLEEFGIPKTLAPYAASFEAAHTAFEKAAEVADEAKGLRDDALALIGEKDSDVDDSIGPLADKMVGAGLGTRTKPFGDASPHSPSKLKGLPYKTEVAAVRDLVTNVSAKKPPAEVKACLAVSSKAVGACDAALKALIGPQAAYSKALAARDALLVDWTRALNKLRIHAKAVWDDDPATLAAVFAEPEKVQRPVKKRKKAAKGKGQGEGKSSPK